MPRTQTVTILFTDMVGSTELASRVGDEAADEIRRAHFATQRDALARTGGQEVKCLGDGLMASFTSAADALECAVSIQQMFQAERHSSATEVPGLRVGIGTGDATCEDDDWFGAPVVESSRLCNAAAAGQILVSDVVRVMAGGRGRHRFQPIEPLSLKGLPEPVAACEVLWDPAPVIPKVRVVLAEDSVLLREGLARVLVDAGFDVVGQAGEPEELLKIVRGDPPDVVVVDIRMPPTHTDEGIRAAQQIRTAFPGTGVLVLSQHLETGYAIRLLEEGAGSIGYLLKDRVANVEQMADAIRRVAAGESVVDPEIVSRLVSKRREHDPLDELTEREREVLGLMAEGRSNQAICEHLFLSPKTIETHIRSLLMKLGIEEASSDNRRVLAVLAFLRKA